MGESYVLPLHLPLPLPLPLQLQLPLPLQLQLQLPLLLLLLLLLKRCLLPLIISACRNSLLQQSARIYTRKAISAQPSMLSRPIAQSRRR